MKKTREIELFLISLGGIHKSRSNQGGGRLKISQNCLRHRGKSVYVRGEGVQNYPKNGYMVYEWTLRGKKTREININNIFIFGITYNVRSPIWVSSTPSLKNVCPVVDFFLKRFSKIFLTFVIVVASVK